MVLLSVESASLANAWVIGIHNNSRCLLPNPTDIEWNPITDYTIQQDLNAAYLASASWNDVPVMIQFVETNSPARTTIFVKSVPNNPSYFGGANALTFTVGNTQIPPEHSCNNSYSDLPLEIDLNDDRIIQQEAQFAGSTVPWTDQDLRVFIIAHEMGHAMGLAHSQVKCSLMWGGTAPSYADNFANVADCGVWFPVEDDMKAVASLYGWTRDSSFNNADGSGSTALIGGYAGYMPPIELKVLTPNSGTYVALNNQTSLPGSNIVVMMAYVTPKTLYRFHLGWDSNLPNNNGGFANLELDNDGAKFVSPQTGVVGLSPSFTPMVNTMYFLELVLEFDGANTVTAHSYVFQEGSQIGNGSEAFRGFSTNGIRNCGLFGCVGKWDQAQSFAAGVWTDSSSNPASDYQINHFWNYQGNKPLVGPPDFAIGSLGSLCLLPGESVQGVPAFLLQSLGGFTGTLNLAPPSVSDSGLSATDTYPTVNVSPSQDSPAWLNLNAGSTSFTYSVSLTATSTILQLSHSASVYVRVDSSCNTGGGGGGGGGSVGAGTLITLANGTRVPVQNLQLGMQLLSYDMSLQQYSVSTIVTLASVATFNQMVIKTDTGKPLIVDQNPAQKVYAMFPNATWALVPVTSLQVGYSLFDASTLTWTPITGIRYENGGMHQMYDIYTTAPYNYLADNYLDPLKT